MRRPFLRWGALMVFLGISLCVRSVQAQDADSGDSGVELPSDEVKTDRIFVWCGAANIDRQELYLSQTQRLKRSSYMALASMGGHFAQTLNARFGMRLAMNAPHCRSFHSAAAAENARMLETARARKNGLQIRDPGIF